jgi:hypothetical protein
MALASAMLGCCVLVSCQSAGVAQPQGATAGYHAGHWTRISDKPRVYYPRGVTATTPSDFMDGEWYRVCDAADTRYFIPFKLPPGSDRSSLIGEVHSLRTDEYQRQLAKESYEESADRLKRVAKSAPVLVPLNLVGAASAVGGGGFFVTVEEYEQWLHDWKKKYGSKRQP